MKKGIISVLAVALCVALAELAWIVWPKGGEEVQDLGRALVLVTSADVPPYSHCDAKTGKIVGVEIDIAREAAARLGCELEVRKVKFSELLPMVSDGEADFAAAGITITEGRRQTVDFSVPHAAEGGMFLYRACDRMPTMISAEMLRVATVDSSTLDFYLAYHGIDSVRYDSFSMAVADLKAKKVDAVFSDSCSVRAAVDKSGGELAASRQETREHFGIAVGKGNARLKAVLDEVIKARGSK